MAIIGDSVTAGLGEERFPRWPQLIAQECRWEVLDLAVFGAKCHSAIEQAQQVPEAASVVILEIGGNDVLGGTSVGGFETSLTRLVQKVVQPGREVFLFELPLPPFYNGYGLAQRRVAARFDVRLIPRTVLMNVLAPSENTVDSIHLSEPGQRAFAEAVKRLRYRP